MLNDFLNSVKGNLLDSLSEETDLNSDKLGSVSDIVTNTFKEGLLDKFKGGQMGDIIELFGNGGTSTPFAVTLVNNTVANLISKVGLSKDLSSKMANVAVPFILEKFGDFASSNGKNNEDGIQDLLNDLVGGAIKDNLLGGLGKKFGF